MPHVSRFMALAIRFERLIQASVVTDYAELARLLAFRPQGVVVKTLPFGTLIGKDTIRACSFARAIAEKTANGTPTGR